jgi:putative phosphoesterase
MRFYQGENKMRVGLISDTHGTWHPAIPDVFQGVAAILHAGDVGSPAVLHRLESLAPVYAVRGNCDSGPILASLPRSRTVEINSICIGLLHGDQLRQDEIESHAAAFFKNEGADVVVHGHTHVPNEVKVGRVLVVNPGALRAPLSFPPTIAILELAEAGALVVNFYELH